MKTIIGIDPGQSGGIAVLRDWDIKLFKMPDTPANILELLDEFSYQASNGEAIAYLEDVGHGMPGQSSASTAKFARHCGHLEMALIAAAIPFIKVTPQKWTRSLGIGSAKDCADHRQWKNRLKARAQELFPRAQLTLSTCDAALIAWYGSRQENKGTDK